MGRWAHGARLSTLMPADASPISTVCLRLASLETITTPSGCALRVALRMLRHTGDGSPISVGLRLILVTTMHIVTTRGFLRLQ